MSLGVHISIQTIHLEVFFLFFYFCSNCMGGTKDFNFPLLHVCLSPYIVTLLGLFLLFFTMKCTEQMEYTLLTFIADCYKFKLVSHHFGIKEVHSQPRRVF